MEKPFSTTPLGTQVAAFLALAEQSPSHYQDAPIMAVARVFRDEGVRVIAKTIEHAGGLVGCYGLVMGNAMDHPIGYKGGKSWPDILKITMREQHFGKGKFLGEGQDINPMPDNEFVYQDQEDEIACITAKLISHQQGMQLDQSTAKGHGRRQRRRL